MRQLTSQYAQQPVLVAGRGQVRPGPIGGAAAGWQLRDGRRRRRVLNGRPPAGRLPLGLNAHRQTLACLSLPARPLPLRVEGAAPACHPPAPPPPPRHRCVRSPSTTASSRWSPPSSLCAPCPPPCPSSERVERWEEHRGGAQGGRGEGWGAEAAGWGPSPPSSCLLTKPHPCPPLPTVALLRPPPTLPSSCSEDQGLFPGSADLPCYTRELKYGSPQHPIRCAGCCWLLLRLPPPLLLRLAAAGCCGCCHRCICCWGGHRRATGRALAQHAVHARWPARLPLRACAGVLPPLVPSVADTPPCWLSLPCRVQGNHGFHRP